MKLIFKAVAKSLKTAKFIVLKNFPLYGITSIASTHDYIDDKCKSTGIT